MTLPVSRAMLATPGTAGPGEAAVCHERLRFGGTAPTPASGLNADGRPALPDTAGA